MQNNAYIATSVLNSILELGLEFSENKSNISILI